jgi:hypothetical protein
MQVVVMRAFYFVRKLILAMGDVYGVVALYGNVCYLSKPAKEAPKKEQKEPPSNENAREARASKRARK